MLIASPWRGWLRKRVLVVLHLYVPRLPALYTKDIQGCDPCGVSAENGELAHALVKVVPFCQTRVYIA